jgi:hypothetical protein
MKLTFLPSKKTFRIVQLTDLHLMGNERDAMTFENIRRVQAACSPDLFVLTGDQAMTKDAVLRYGELAQAMTNTGVPWTFCFGNHDAEHGVTHEALMKATEASPTLLFETGEAEGYGNFAIDVEGGFEPLTLYLFDTHNDTFYNIDTESKWGYDSFRGGQIAWYLREAKKRGNDARKSLAFYHIPIIEYRRYQTPLAKPLSGSQNEPISCPPVDTGFFAAVKDAKSTIAMFVGHDHYNDFTFESDGVIFAFGRVSGQYDYGDPTFEKGFRIIDWNEHHMTTQVVLYKDIP